MKIIGTGSFDANVTTTAKSLGQVLLTRPEISANVVNLFEKNFSAFSSYLARKKLIKKGAFPDMNDPTFRVIGNTKFMWSVKGFPFRKGAIVGTVTNIDGSTTDIGKGGQIVNLPLNTNYFSPNDNLELKNRRTMVFLLDEYPDEISVGVWNYKAKLVARDKTSFIPASLLTEGSEVGFSHTSFPELSETGYEKNTYPEWHSNHMTIQRMSYSISGTAAATVIWLEHNGQKIWVTTQDFNMLERWAYARENQLIFGKGTVDESDTVHLKDLKFRDIRQGDGLIHSGDGSMKYQYNNLSTKIIERVMQNLQLLANGTEMVELLAIGGQKFIWDFSRLLRDVFKYNPVPLFTGGNDSKGVDATFYSYAMGGVKVIPVWSPAFDAAWRPQETDIYGDSKESGRAIFVSLGNTIGNEPNVELVALGGNGKNRSFTKKYVDGMTSIGNDNSRGYVANSVDGAQCHVLSETGLKLGNPYSIAELYIP